MTEPEIYFERRGHLALVTLNRPRQLNALTHTMVRELAPRLPGWARDPEVRAVVVQAAGDRAFCAGGDIRALYEMGTTGRVEDARAFWREEYVLNRAIKRFAKPFVSLIDGIVMGGGVGLAFHGSHRVAGDRFLFAMPEVGIGFFPDVGATYLLPRLPGFAGTYLAVTGARIGAADAAALGLVTHCVPSERLPHVVNALAAGDAVDAVLAKVRQVPQSAPLDRVRALIRHVFHFDSIPKIMTNLERWTGGHSEFGAETLATMRTKSPTSMALALEQMRRGVGMSFEEAMTAEFRVVSRIARGHDFYEGVRAVIVDKDNAPRWQPARIEDVDPAAIAAHFAPLPDDLVFRDAS